MSKIVAVKIAACFCSMLSFDIANQRINQVERTKHLIVCTGGGSAGHVIPGLSVAEELEKREFRVAWIGGSRGMERRLVAAAGFPFYGIPVGKLRRYLSVENAKDVFRVLAGVLRAVQLLRSLRPAALFSKGGFASVPAVVAAWSLRIPVVTHESDTDPGLATRINARFSRWICVGYPGMELFFRPSLRRRVTVTGNPVRSALADSDRVRGREVIGLPVHPQRPLLLVLGGSQGARQLNDAVGTLLPRLLDSWDVVHQTGAGNSVTGGPVSSGPGEYRPVAFIREGMADVLAAADLIVCRAGAGTLWENAILARPMILIPLVRGSRGDQLRNAERFGQEGGAVVLVNSETLHRDLWREIERLRMEPARAEELGRRARSLVRLDATEVIAGLITAVSGRQGNKK